MLSSWSLLVTHLKYRSVCVSAPNFLTVPLPPIPSGNHNSPTRPLMRFEQAGVRKHSIRDLSSQFTPAPSQVSPGPWAWASAPPTSHCTGEGLGQLRRLQQLCSPLCRQHRHLQHSVWHLLRDTWEPLKSCPWGLSWQSVHFR